MDFGIYFAYSAWPDARFLPRGGGLASILQFLDRSESVGERRRLKREVVSDSVALEIDALSSDELEPLTKLSILTCIYVLHVIARTLCVA